MVLVSDLRTRKMEVAVDHLESSMTKNLFQAENITSVKEIISGESMATKMSV